MSDTAWLIVALATVFAGIGGYAASITARTRKLERSLREPRGGEHRSA